MLRHKGVLIFLLIASTGLLQAQGISLYKNKHVTIAGNSIADFQIGFQPEELPLLAPANVVIRGMDSYPCNHLLPVISFLVPSNSNVVVLFDSTNDVANHVPIQQHMECIEQSISALLTRNNALRVVVANTPPWTHWNPCTNTYRDDSVLSDIATYNSAYADPVTGLQALWPTEVRVADVWTPNVGSDGWAIPQDMTGPCGIHPGDRSVWSSSWQHFSQAYTGVVMSAVNGGW